MSFDSTLAGLGISRTASNSPQVSATDTSSQMDQGDFLTLMTAQLKNQDPFEPVDNTQMVAQMAQFSSLAGISEMNTTLKAMADKLGGSTMGDAVSYVGRTVLTEGDVAWPRTTGGLAGAVELSKDATNVQVTITSPDGATLRTLELGPQDAGTVGFDWDGATDSGDPAGDGPFTVKVTALNADGSVGAKPLVWAPVAAVSMADGEPVLLLPGLGQVPISAVRQVG